MPLIYAASCFSLSTPIPLTGMPWSFSVCSLASKIGRIDLANRPPSKLKLGGANPLALCHSCGSFDSALRDAILLS
ncbi:hypothetical protein LSO2F_300004 [Candidatus Liberibacter solanacearum]